MARGSKPCQPDCACGKHNGLMTTAEERLRRRRAAQARYRAANLAKVLESGRLYREVNRERIREGWPARLLKYTHGMSLEDWAAMWAAQMGRCYLCMEPLPRERSQVHIDHDHTCCPPKESCGQCRRGLAHKACNQLIGMAGDSPDRLRLIANNLERTQDNPARLGSMASSNALAGR